jgi:hypothetical protein
LIDEDRRTVPDGTLIVNRAHAGVLAELGIAQVSDAFRDGCGRVLRRLPDRDNVLCETAGGVYFLKRHRPSRVDWGLVEWTNGKLISDAGIRTPEPVCAGSGVDGSSFVLTAGLAGEPLDDLLRRGRPDPRTSRELTLELARLVGRLHDLGLCHRDLYLCHVFVDLSQSPGDRLSLIDLQRVRGMGRLRRTRWRVKDLAALAYSSIGLPASDRDRARVLVACVPERGWRRRRLARRIWRRASRLLDRHGVPVAPEPR